MCHGLKPRSGEKNIYLLPFHPNDERSPAPLPGSRRDDYPILIHLDKKGVVETRNVFITRGGVMLTNETISWTSVTGIPRRPVDSELSGAHVYYDRELAGYEVTHAANGHSSSALDEEWKYHDMQGLSFRCPKCTVSLRLGFVHCPLCDAMMMMRAPGGSAGPAGASASGASAGPAGASTKPMHVLMAMQKKGDGPTLT